MRKHSRIGWWRRGAGALLWVVLFLVAAVLGAPYEAAAFEAVGLPLPAVKLYAFTVRVLDGMQGGLAPDWAFDRLAVLRPSPERLVQLAQLARERHPRISKALYERAIPAGTSSQRVDWLEQYADVLVPMDVYEAARARAAAAGIAAATYPARTVRDFEQSLTLVDDRDVRWQEARFLLHAHDARASDILQEIVKRDQSDVAANYALGLLQWHRGDMDGAQASLQRAAADRRYAPTLQAFVSAREAAERLQILENEEATQRQIARAAHDEAVARHEEVYERLHKFSCDPRQWRDWESHPDEEIAAACDRAARDAAIGRLVGLALLFLGPEFLLGRVGAAAELGAFEARGLTAEALAAARAGASAEESYAISVTGVLRTGEQDAVERSVAARKQVGWKVVGTQYTAVVEAEQTWILNKIEVVLAVRERQILQRFEPLEQDAKAKLSAGQMQRDREIRTVTEPEPVFKVKLGEIRLDAPPPDCNDQQQRSETARCAQPSGAPAT